MLFWSRSVPPYLLFLFTVCKKKKKKVILTDGLRRVVFLWPDHPQWVTGLDALCILQPTWRRKSPINNQNYQSCCSGVVSSFVVSHDWVQSARSHLKQLFLPFDCMEIDIKAGGLLVVVTSRNHACCVNLCMPLPWLGLTSRRCMQANLEASVF